MINTLNETSLHKTLKTLYSVQNEGSRTEEKVGQYICDIVTKEGNVIEIQTGSLGHLLAKVMYLISQKKKVTVVYPLPTTKYIETKKQSAENITPGSAAARAIAGKAEARCGTQTAISPSRRKSPAKKTIYSIFRELTALCPVLLNKYFTLEVLEVTLTEERTTTAEPVQSANKMRRFRKNWVKTGKHLDSINETHVFHGKKAYLDLLPKHIPAPFTVKELEESFHTEGIKIDRTSVQLLVWVYTHAGLMEFVGKENRANCYIVPSRFKKEKPRRS